MVDLARPDEPANRGGTYVLAGEGGYEGLTAIYEIVEETGDCEFAIEGLIFEDELAQPEPYIPE
jgi:hypothetical protein